MSLDRREANRPELERFVDALFRYAAPGTYASLRSFPHRQGEKAARIEAIKINGHGLGPLITAAQRHATWAANWTESLVFAPPVATFTNGSRARQVDLAQGLALSLEADSRAAAALEAMVSALGVPTVIMASGGTWTDPATGEAEDKIHIHYRLKTPTTDEAGHALLKTARRLAALLTGADPTTVPTVHPLRWAGSLHMKDPNNPKLARIVGGDADAEIALDDAIAALKAACKVAGLDPDKAGTNGSQEGGRQDTSETADLIQTLLSGETLQGPLTALSARYAGAGMSRRQIVDTLRGLLEAVPENARGGAERWQARWDGVDRLAASAVEKFGPAAIPPETVGDTAARSPKVAALAGHDWPAPELSLLCPHRRPAPELPLDLFGRFWSRWIADAADAKGSRPDFVCTALLAGVSGLAANARRASPWPGWVEPPIVWVAEIGLPSSGKSPAQDAVMDLVRELERELDLDFDERAREHQVSREVAKAKRERWEADVRLAIKKETPPPEPPRDGDTPEPPARRRLFTNDSTVERLARIAAVNDRGILLNRDELAGWLGQLDKYGGNGGDRAFYLESYGGRPYVVDRVKDGTALRVPYLSIAVLGGIQPDRLASLLLAGDDDGLAARHLYVWPEPARPKRPRRAPDDQAALSALRWILTLGPIENEGRKMPRVLPFEPEAADDLQAWCEQVADMEGSAAGLFLSWLGKLPGMAVRLALLLELLWWCPAGMAAPEPAAVSQKAVRAALGFLEAYAVPMARRAFGEAALPQADRDAITLARWLHARRPMPETVNARELRHADALPSRDAERYDRALAELEAAGWLRPAPRPSGGGRPRKDWLVNPKLQEAGA